MPVGQRSWSWRRPGRLQGRSRLKLRPPYESLRPNCDSASTRVRSRDIPLQRVAVPLGQVGRGCVGLLQESEQKTVRVARRTHGIVWQDELAEAGIVKSIRSAQAALAVA